jgi:hypothetical protein
MLWLAFFEWLQSYIITSVMYNKSGRAAEAAAQWELVWQIECSLVAT